MSAVHRPNRYVLRGAFVAERLDAAHLHHKDLADALGLSRSYFSQLVNGHRDASPRVRRALVDHPLFADVAEADLWEVLPPRFEQLALPCLVDAGAGLRGAA